MEMAKTLEILNDLSTACLTDACLRLDIAVRFAPSAIRPLMPGTKIHGAVRPARHFGGVDVFLEALENASAGEVLVIDNDGRLDEACIGDLISLEVKMAGLNGIVIWGCPGCGRAARNCSSDFQPRLCTCSSTASESRRFRFTHVGQDRRMEGRHR